MDNEKPEITFNLVPCANYHEEQGGGNGYSHYPCILLQVVDNAGQIRLITMEDIPCLDAMDSRDNAVLASRKWLQNHYEDLAKNLVKCLTD